MGFANLQVQENRLSSLKSSLSSYRSQLEKMKRRKSNIESIIEDMKSICNNRTDDVNTHLNKMINNYEDATKGISSAYALTTTTTSDKEKDISSDNNMNNALNQLQSELNDVNLKISELETNINNTNSQISSCEASIRTEKYNIASSYRDQFNSAQAKVNATYAAYKADPKSVQLKQKYDRACRERDTARTNYNNYRGWL